MRLSAASSPPARPAKSSSSCATKELEEVTKAVLVGAAAVPEEGVHLVHLHEEKVFTQFREEEEHDTKSWICDIGAMNHMSGSQAGFTEVDSMLRGTVHLRDNSVAENEGRGTVVF
jgi:hypothetical protein